MKRAYFDANAVIYYIEQNPTYLPIMVKRMFGLSGDELVCCVTSDLVRMETRVHPLRHGHTQLLSRFDEFFAANQSHIVPLGRAVFDLATQLRADHSLKTPDALHLAAALQSGCDEFWTNDDRLANAALGHIEVINMKALHDTNT
jgi:predicted nucleic acid-binding protein